MSGDQSSKLDERNKVLDEIERKLGLDELSKEFAQDENEIQQYLCMSRDQLEKLSADDCEHGCYIIARYTLFLQRKINRLKSIKIWADNELKLIVAKEFDSHSGPWEMREPKILNENAAAKRLKDMSVFADQQLARLEYLPRSIDGIAKRLEGVKFARIREMSYAED